MECKMEILLERGYTLESLAEMEVAVGTQVEMG